MTSAPICKKIPHELEIHNDKRVDNYYWLNNRENPEVIDYLNKENEYTNAYFKLEEGLQNEIYNEIVGRIDPKESSVPFFLDGYYYYQKYEEGVQYPFYCRKLGYLIAEEEIYLNVNDLAIGKSYCGMGKVEFNTQNSILAYSVDFVSRRLYTIYFKNNITGEILPDEIPNTSGGFAWANDGKTIFYTLKDENTLRSFKIMKHILGTPISEDKIVYIEEDDTFTTSVYTSKSKEFIMIGSQSTVSTEYRYLNANRPNEEFKIFCPRRRNHEYSVYHYKNHFYILSNWNAQNFKLCVTDISNTKEENWTEILPHDKQTLIEGLDIFNGFLVVDERNNGLTRFRVINLNNQSQYFIDLEEPSYMAQSGSNPNFDSETFRYVFTSLKTPSTVIDFNLNNQNKEIKKQQKVIGGYDPSEYITERLWATAEDETKIPISIIYHKNMVKNGENPTLLYAYGSYGISSDATFSIARLSLLQEFTPEYNVKRRQFQFLPLISMVVQDQANPEILRSAHQLALDYYLAHLPVPPWESLEDLKEYLEAFHHAGELGEWQLAYNILNEDRGGEEKDKSVNSFLDLQGFYRKRADLYEEIIAGSQREQDCYRNSLNRLGNCYNYLGQYEKAIAYHQQSLDISEAMGDQQGVASSLHTIGSILLKLENYSEAERKIQASLVISQDIGYKYLIAYSLRVLAKIAHQTNRPELALSHCQEALELCQELGIPLVKYCEELLGQIQATLENN